MSEKEILQEITEIKDGISHIKFSLNLNSVLLFVMVLNILFA